jgi:uncharacterized protein (DUF2236 family)
LPVLPSDDALLMRAGIADLPAVDEGLFRNGSWLRRVSAEPALLFGGGRALLLEVAHPLVAAGVAEHSAFRSDPFGRLTRTLDALHAITFEERSAALAAARSVERVHGRVRGELACDVGPFRRGTPYSGRDPQLVFWVWATLADTARRVYEHFVAPLEEAAVASWYADQSAIARLLGVPPELLPPSHAGFQRAFGAVLESETLTVGAQGREIADAVLRLAGGGPVRLVTAALLPARLRAAFGLAWDDERAERFRTLAVSVRSLRRSAAERAGC